MILLPIAVAFVVGFIFHLVRALRTVSDERVRLERKAAITARQSMPKKWKPATHTHDNSEVHHTTPWYVGS